MTAARTDERDTREPMSARIWLSSQGRLKAKARAKNIGHTTLAGDVVEAAMGYITCSRCHDTVPVVLGDMSGSTFLDAAAAAVKEVAAQKCWEGAGRERRPAHKPVLVGAKAGSRPPVVTGERDEAPRRERGAQERTEPPASAPARAARLVSLAAENGHDITTASELPSTATAVFQEPLGQRREEHPVPVAADQSGKKGRTCKHRNMRMRKGVCPDCSEWVVKP